MPGRCDVIELPLFQAAQRHLRDVAGNRCSCNAQDGAAWDRFYKVCDGLIHRFATTFGARADDLDDCSQEAWAQLVPLLTRFEYDPQRGEFRTWLFQIVRSATVNFLRRRNHQQTIQNRLQEIAMPTTESCDSSGVAIEPAADLPSLLKCARKCLTPENYRLMRMRWLDEQSVGDVADRLGMTHEQVWYREHRVRKSLRKALAGSERENREMPHVLRAA